MISPGGVPLSDSSAQRQAVCFLLFSGQHILMVMVIHLEVHPLIRRELLDPDVIFTEHKKKKKTVYCLQVFTFQFKFETRKWKSSHNK